MSSFLQAEQQSNAMGNVQSDGPAHSIALLKATVETRYQYSAEVAKLQQQIAREQEKMSKLMLEESRVEETQKQQLMRLPPNRGPLTLPPLRVS